MISFILNDQQFTTELPPGSVALDLIRKAARLTGTKEGCREGDCGACTVLLGIPQQNGMKYMAVNSCLLPVGELRGRHLVTVEGLSPSEGYSPVQSLIVNEGASQCGFCTPGIVMSLTGYLLSTVSPITEGAIDSLGGNICRCTGYVSIRKAAELLCSKIGPSPALSPESPLHIKWLIEKRIIPPFFEGIESRLNEIGTPESPDVMDSGMSDVIRVAGGTDLFAIKAEKLKNAELLFFSRQPEMNGITVKNDHCFIGAAATVSNIMDSEVFNCIEGFSRIRRLISSTQIRNRATLGGNIVNASPIGDLSIIFLALDSVALISNGIEKRQTRLKNFFRGYKILDLAPDEIIEGLSFRIPDRNTEFNFEKVSMRKHLDIAAVNTAARIKVENGKILEADLSAGGVAPVPLFLKETSSVLKGKLISSDMVLLAADTARQEVKPIDDVRGSAEYKRILLGRLIAAHFIELFPDLVNVKELL